MKKLILFSNHNDWEFKNTHYVTHKGTGTELWIANGASFFTGYNGKISFGLLERHILWWAFNNMRLRKMLGEDK